MTDFEVASALEEAILGGEPFHFACGCFGVIIEVHEYNADWVHVERRKDCALYQHDFPSRAIPHWRKRNGDFILEDEWNKHIEMSEHVYGRR